MDKKYPHLLLSTSLTFFLFLFLIPLLPIATSSNPKENKPSPIFDFIKHFNNSMKGDKVKGLHVIKKYLVNYGYINHSEYFHDDYFDETLEYAIKTYQLNYDLNVVGTLDFSTLSLMTMPRCGLPDIIDGTNLMQLGKKLHQHIPSYYELGNTKWPKFNLSWALRPGTRGDAKGPINQAFGNWASVSRFKFANTKEFTRADLQISFLSRNHGDSGPFDGPGGILAHAGMPPDGKLHFDADENWTVGAKPGAIDIGTVGLHEIGHLLGLGHSSVREAIMFPYIGAGSTKGLNQDDIEGIKALYHF